MGVANGNPSSAKFISEKILSLENLALYGISTTAFVPFHVEENSQMRSIAKNKTEESSPFYFCQDEGKA